jgi:hypothetical protein
VPATALAVAVPWLLYDPLLNVGLTEDPVVCQACIVLGATILMVGVAAGWHVAGWPLVGPHDELPRFLREKKKSAGLVILSLIVIAWGMAAAVAGAQIIEALTEWGTAGQIVAWALVTFGLTVIGLGLQFVSGEKITRQDISEDTPTAARIVAALLAAIAGATQRAAGYLASVLSSRSRR